jgi:hypothetical protein
MSSLASGKGGFKADIAEELRSERESGIVQARKEENKIGW